MPSNQVYSIVQDSKGFIWLGCDAGLFKFDGQRFHSYRNVSQKSRSVSGLCFSSSGKLYCNNFQNQIFYLENDTLRELKHSLGSILHITCDLTGNLLVNHSKGFAVYSELQKTWKNYTHFDDNAYPATRSTRVSTTNRVCFLATSGIGSYKNKKTEIIARHNSNNRLSSDYIMEWWKDELWVFPYASQNPIYKIHKGNFIPVKNKNLLNALQGKQITNVRQLPDQHLWICTYDGVINYNPETDSAWVLYPEMAFSDCLFDREGNYWFSTLHFGMICCPEMSFLIWNDFKNNKLTKLCEGRGQLYFASASGNIGCLELRGTSLRLLETGGKADIQMLNYIASDEKAYYFANHSLYEINGASINQVGSLSQALKRIQKIENDYFLCCSNGTYLYNLQTNTIIRKLCDGWSRDMCYDKKNGKVWICTNNGLKKIVRTKNEWEPGASGLLDSAQIIACDFHETTYIIYAVTFAGKIYRVEQDEKIRLFDSLPQNVQAYKVKYHSEKLYMATNKGLWIYDLKRKTFETLNVFSGLASNSIQDILILNENIWLATGNGLQKIPLVNRYAKLRAKIYHKGKNSDTLNVTMCYSEPLILVPEVSFYSSNGNFEYAYRVGKNDWVRLPGSVDSIKIQNLPAGEVEIRLKTIDHLGRDSENTLITVLEVRPPFWKTWWFTASALIIFLALVAITFFRLLKMRQRKMQLQNEMNALKLTAVKSQMNPHFIFNVLTSIKGYIYENDKNKAVSYLDDFSDLMRRILEMSEVQYSALNDELKTMQLYIELEGMMLSDFSYSIDIESGLSTDNIFIPTLLLQPYIENAFKHGLRHKQGDKKLTIEIHSTKAGMVEIMISDNGIGRKAARILNDRHPSKHTSFATSALQKRIDLINLDGRYEVNLKIVDLESPGGTVVILTVYDKSDHS